jgi:phospholipid/cholesterol/gamma-HCH transport system substrate-binding protein
MSSASENVAETLVGALVLATAIGFVIYTAQGANVGVGTGEYALSANFRKADGLVIGGDVRISGVKIGSVTSLALDTKTYNAKVGFAIRGDVEIPTDSSARIASEGLLGGSYVSIEPGADDAMLADGGVLTHTQGSIDILDLVGKAITGGGG